ncbi:MAG: sialidase family protein [Xanthomonadales bacterium]|nr:sialidase family protein [Xanthomonadales bacterium]
MNVVWLLAGVLVLLGTAPATFAGEAPEHAPETLLEFILSDHPVDAAASELPHVEPHIATDPSSPQRLLAGSIVVAPESGGPWHCAALFSVDGGASWNRHDFAMDRCIDPWALITAEGDFVLAAIDFQLDRPESEQFRLQVYRSSDRGETWSGPQDLGGQHDHELLIQEPGGDLVLVSRRLVRTGGGFPRHVIGLMRASGRPWHFEQVATLRPGNLAQTATGLVRLSDGTLVVSYIDFQRNVDDFGQQGLLRQPRAWVVRAMDGGTRFSEPLFASEGCGATDGFAGYPALAADPTPGPYRDRLYHVCVRADFDGLALSRSHDGGETWTEPLDILHSKSAASRYARTPMLAVNREGVLAAAWYDRSDDPDRQCQDTYVTYSADGGDTFAPAVRVSTEQSCPNTPENGRVAQSWPMGGDYGSLTAAADGAFHLLWADSRTGRFQLRHASFRVHRRVTGSAPGPDQR